MRFIDNAFKSAVSHTKRELISLMIHAWSITAAFYSLFRNFPILPDGLENSSSEILAGSLALSQTGPKTKRNDHIACKEYIKLGT